MYFLSLQAKLETKALKAKRPGFSEERYNETSYYIENGKEWETENGLLLGATSVIETFSEWKYSILNIAVEIIWSVWKYDTLRQRVYIYIIV